MYKIGLVIFSILMVGCFSSDDEGFGRNIQVKVSDAFVVENNKNYTVGDTIFFDQKFSRYVEEEGFSNLLDVFETTNDEAFGYSFGLEKFSEFSNNYTSVFIDEQFIIATKVDIDFYYYGGYGVAAILNDTQDAYESRVGIILPEAGEYRLNLENVYFSNGYDNDVIHLDITHRFSEASTVDVEFSVTE